MATGRQAKVRNGSRPQLVEQLKRKVIKTQYHALAIERNRDEIELGLELRQSAIAFSAQAVVLFSFTKNAFDFPFAFVEPFRNATVSCRRRTASTSSW